MTGGGLPSQHRQTAGAARCEAVKSVPSGLFELHYDCLDVLTPRTFKSSAEVSLVQCELDTFAPPIAGNPERALIGVFSSFRKTSATPCSQAAVPELPATDA